MNYTNQLTFSASIIFPHLIPQKKKPKIIMRGNISKINANILWQMVSKN